MLRGDSKNKQKLTGIIAREGRINGNDFQASDLQHIHRHQSRNLLRVLTIVS